MSQYCDELQEKLITEGSESIENDQQAQNHLLDCSECFSLLEAQKKVDSLLEALPAHNASDNLVQNVVAQIEDATSEESRAVAEGRVQKTILSTNAISSYIAAHPWGIFAALLASGFLLYLLARLSGTLGIIGGSIGFVLVLSLVLFVFLYFPWASAQVQLPKMKLFRRRLLLWEYGLASALIAVFALASVTFLGQEAKQSFRRVSDQMSVSSESIYRQEKYAPPANKPQQRWRNSSKNKKDSRRSGQRVPASQAIEEAKKLGRRENIPFGGDNSRLASIDKLTQSKSNVRGKVLAEPTEEEEMDYLPEKQVPREDAPAPVLEGIAADGNLAGFKLGELSASDEAQSAGERSSEVRSNGNEYFSKDQQRADPAFADDDVYKGKKLDNFSVHASRDGITSIADREDESKKVLKKKKAEKAREIRPSESRKRQPTRSLGNLQETREKKEISSTKGEKDLLHSSLSKSLGGGLTVPDELVLPKDSTENSAELFLASRRMLDGLRFKDPTGYWANTYIPGAPTVRRLHTTLLGQDRSTFSSMLAQPASLHDAAHQPSQPFDSPENSAIALYLHTDRTGIDQESRMLLQVGLKGTERHSGIRPAMNIGLVFDMRGNLPPQVVAQMKALIFALNKAKDLGDGFSLTIAGKPGGLLIEPKQFTHGYLTVRLRELLEEEKTKGATLSLPQAMEKAIQRVRETDDPNAPLGSSAIILVTAQSVNTQLPTLSRIAHQSAVEGIPVSVIGIGKQIKVRQLEEIALSGQGNRRILEKHEDPKKLIDLELSSVSRVVARALRLRIRLAPGVKLVNIIGSYRLDQARAERVREAEKSIDRRIAKNLGIAADRGDDEEGIQIVIPSFHAGDSHVILLDIVAPGPGPIADARVRYKDLVHLRNGVARTNLSLDRRQSAPGPLEQNVLKNLLALKLSATLDQAGRALAAGNSAEAVRLTRNYQLLLIGLLQQFQSFARDPDIANDLEMLGEYLVLLEGRAPSHSKHREHLAQSLLFAGKLKVLPHPAVE